MSMTNIDSDKVNKAIGFVKRAQLESLSLSDAARAYQDLTQNLNRELGNVGLTDTFINNAYRLSLPNFSSTGRYRNDNQEEVIYLVEEDEPGEYSLMSMIGGDSKLLKGGLRVTDGSLISALGKLFRRR
jgi:hypothetical protein